ncbi:MAG: 5-oxoprolinase subunit PxpB, partial [Planctomycetes bacterium]|nr:5-oxoprolinase subunit PxpB [Planctomycetota bacterium]
MESSGSRSRASPLRGWQSGAAGGKLRLTVPLGAAGARGGGHLDLLGNTAWLVRVASRVDPEGLAQVRAVARALCERPPAGVSDIVAAYATVTVHFDPAVVARAAVGAWIDAVLARGAATPGAAATATTAHVLPVRYGEPFGPDLALVAERSGLSAADVIERHAAGRYVVAAIGFTPGFAYLAGLAPELATPRRATPRLEVAAGSVAIGGAQTGVYPLLSPGGWNVIGRTSERLFDPARTPAARLCGGDSVRFEPVAARRFARRLRTVALPPAARAAPLARAMKRAAAFEVLEPGTQSSLQDRGRSGHAAQGVAPGGALDPLAAAVANRLVGNAPAAAVLECALTGPRLRVLRPVRVALAGARV